MKHLLASTALGIICAACSSVADVPDPVADMTETEISLQPEGWIAKSLPEIAEGLQTGQVSSVELVLAYQARIEQIDRNGPALQSVLALNPTALDDARDSDERRMLGKGWGPLDGVPILLKDNIESLDPVATTAGALALKDNITGRDSPLVAGLRAQGAIILGKTNLSQWANFRSNESLSGWSALGGQVRNPHMLDRNPCGSSSGSAAAAAASLAAGTVGTETNGSIICPSNVNGVVGFKPTVGVVPQQYIIPISHSQDTAGPMTKTVKGAAMMLTAMAGMDASIDYVARLDSGSLSGKRVGVMRFAQGSNADIHARFDAALGILEAQGAELVEIDTFDPDAENFWGDALSVLEYEFRHTLNAYLADLPDTVATRSLAELIAFNEANADIELALFDQDLLESSQAKGPMTDEAYLNALAAIQSATRENGIDSLLAEHAVDMLVSPSGPVSPRVDPINGDTWPSWAGAGYLAAIAGYPHITVPMGDVHGVPIGFSIMGAKGTDAEILSWGYAYEQASQMRVEPQYLSNAEARPEIAAAMKAK
ncbi:MAG: amidase [Hyphomonas sp.]|nr:amidase [Hyphomonas sp.]